MPNGRKKQERQRLVVPIMAKSDNFNPLILLASQHLKRNLNNDLFLRCYICSSLDLRVVSSLKTKWKIKNLLSKASFSFILIFTCHVFSQIWSTIWRTKSNLVVIDLNSKAALRSNYIIASILFLISPEITSYASFQLFLSFSRPNFHIGVFSHIFTWEHHESFCISRCKLDTN